MDLFAFVVSGDPYPRWFCFARCMLFPCCLNPDAVCGQFLVREYGGDALLNT